MCDTLLIPCNKDHTASGGGIVALVDAIVVVWKAAKFTYRRTVEFAVGLAVITVALYVAVRWTVKAAQRAYRWYAARPVNRGQREPVAALPAEPTAMTLADLRLKEPANS